MESSITYPSSVLAAYTCPFNITKFTDYKCGSTYTNKPVDNPYPYQCANYGTNCYTLRNGAEMGFLQALLTRTNPAPLTWTGVYYNTTASTWLTVCNTTVDYSTFLGTALNQAISANSAPLLCHAMNASDSYFFPCNVTMPRKVCIGNFQL
ncbi:unnamed protein product, partial [Mesorhabditis spiculigera]